MQRRIYKPVCQWCGKSGTSRHWGSQQGGVPNGTPRISGKCTSSPNGQHAPRWEIA